MNSFNRHLNAKGIAALTLLILLLPLFESGVAHAQKSPAENLDALVAFQTPIGTFLSAASPARQDILSSDAKRIGQWEQFKMIPLRGSKYAVQIWASGRYLTAIGGGGIGRAGAVTTSATSAGRFEQFTLACAESGWCALRTAGGHYVATGDGIVRTDARTATAVTLFRVLRPRKESQGSPASPTARAKTGVILGQIAGPIVAGDVGVDRMGTWEDAVSHGDGAGRSKAGASMAYDHLVVAQAPSGGGRPPVLNRQRIRDAAAQDYEEEVRAWRDRRMHRDDAPAAQPESEAAPGTESDEGALPSLAPPRPADLPEDLPEDRPSNPSPAVASGGPPAAALAGACQEHRGNISIMSQDLAELEKQLRRHAAGSTAHKNLRKKIDEQKQQLEMTLQQYDRMGCKTGKSGAGSAASDSVVEELPEDRRPANNANTRRPPAAQRDDSVEELPEDRPASNANINKPSPPTAGAQALCDVSGRWKGDYGVVRNYTQSGNTVNATTDYFFGWGMRHEVLTGTLKGTGSGTSFEFTIDFTEHDGSKGKGHYVVSVSCGADGKATRFGNQTRVQ